MAVMRMVFIGFLLADRCISAMLCGESSSKYHTCNKYDRVYCCGNSSGDYSCGEYFDSCDYKGDGFKDCYSLFIDQWIVYAFSIGLFVVTVVIACVHKSRKTRVESEQVIGLSEGNQFRNGDSRDEI